MLKTIQCKQDIWHSIFRLVIGQSLCNKQSQQQQVKVPFTREDRAGQHVSFSGDPIGALYCTLLLYGEPKAPSTQGQESACWSPLSKQMAGLCPLCLCRADTDTATIGLEVGGCGVHWYKSVSIGHSVEENGRFNWVHLKNWLVHLCETGLKAKQKPISRL